MCIRDSPQCLQEVATGAGKTIITATLSSLVEQYGRSIVIVPNKDLVRQTFEDYENCGLDVGVYFGDKKDIGKTHTICTWQSLNSLLKRSKAGEANIQDFIEDVICVMVDEVHQAKADVLKDLLTGVFSNVPIRWGLTGTIPKSDWESASLRSSLGEVIHKLAAKELQDQGVLAKCHVNIVQLIDTQVHNGYQEELKYLVTNKERIEYFIKSGNKISQIRNRVSRITGMPRLISKLKGVPQHYK